MIDQGLLDRLKPACARILRADNGAACGTGYLVGDRLLATCHHVVSEITAEPLRCRFGDIDIMECGAQVLRWDSVRDTALLELDASPSAEPVSPADTASPGGEWYGYGFAEFAEGLGLPLDGRVMDARTVDKDGRPAMCVFVNLFGGLLPDSVGGFSGTPILAGRRLLGQLFRVLGAKDGWQKPHLGICYATPAWTVAALVAAGGSGDVGARIAGPHPELAPGPASPGASATAEGVSRYESGAEAIEQLRAAPDPNAVRRALERWTSAGLPRDEGILAACEALIGMAAADDALRLLGPVAGTARGRQLRALALSVKGDHAAAQALLRQLPSNEETAGITGGILKRRWLQEGKKAWLVASYESYRCQNEVEPAAYLGVNVAALALQLGNADESLREAGKAKSLVLATPVNRRTHWDWASLAECELLLGEFEAARRHYEVAAGMAAGKARDIAVMRRQARLDLERLGRPRDALDAVLRVGGVACFVSALLGDDFWTAPRVAALRARIDAVLGDRPPGFGYGSAARGADLVIVDALLGVGATPFLSLPMPREAFAAEWVGPSWARQFQRLPADRLSIVGSASPQRPFSGCDIAAMKAAADMAGQLDETPVLIAVPPPPGVEDARGVPERVAWWREYVRGDVVEISNLEPA